MLRLRNFEKAIEWTEKSLNSPFVHAHAQGYAILAMAHWHLGHKDEARAMLAKGNALAPPSLSDDALAQAQNWKAAKEVLGKYRVHFPRDPWGFRAGAEVTRLDSQVKDKAAVERAIELLEGEATRLESK